VILVLFDLPAETSGQRGEVNRFRRRLRKTGYVLLQKSVYYKHIRNTSLRAYEIASLERGAAELCGTVIALPIPLKTFCEMSFVKGLALDFDRMISPIIEI
jgi:CRISPR-associated protein Cas2